MNYRFFIADDTEERKKMLDDLNGIVELNHKLKEKLKYVPKKSEDVINEYSHLDDAEINYDEMSKVNKHFIVYSTIKILFSWFIKSFIT